MRYQRFEDLPVWKTAIELAVAVFSLTAKPPFRSQFSLRDQIERAAVSVSNNTAEGFERGTNNELLMFIYIARGSAGEVRSMSCLLEVLPHFEEIRHEIPAIKAKAESCSRQLKAWAASLQNSEHKGERYVTDKLKRSEQMTRDRDQFLRELSEIQKKNSASRS